MDYYCLIQSVVAYIENRLKTEIDLRDLERVTGFSLAHTRDVFKKCTQMSLSRYLNYRKISHAAFEMAYTDRRILDIACEYGFETYDTFTRAFKRVAGITPQNFRALKVPVGRIKLTASMFGPGILHETGVKKPLFNPWEEKKMLKSMEKSKDTCVLYGVPKVKYCYEECTPFPSALKACLNYMGQDISYSYLMASTGASFRLRWHLKEWDGGNVDIMAIYENPWLAFEKAFQSAGRQFKIFEKTPKTTKEAFMDVIKSEIDAGRPVIALGIIGPPEACIVTGYRDGGQTLLGWNFFQDNPEFAKDVTIDESGYFICSTWWENPETRALLSIGESQDVKLPLHLVLKNAIDVMANESIMDYAGGPRAYEAWASALSDEKEFPKEAILPLLFERLMCQMDAMNMIGEGRSYASCFMKGVGAQEGKVKKECDAIAALFEKEVKIIHEMGTLLGGWIMGEDQARKLADPDTRKTLVQKIHEAKALDYEAYERMKGVYLQFI